MSRSWSYCELRWRQSGKRFPKSAIEIDPSIWREEIGIEIDPSIWREEIGNRNRHLTLSPPPHARHTSVRRVTNIVLIFAIIITIHSAHDHDVVLFTIPMSGAAVCWIFLDGGLDDTRMPIVRDCACRGNDAGFAHVSCTITYAQKKSEQASIDDIPEFITPWRTCPTCLQSYQNDLAIHIADEFVSFAKKSYGYPGNELVEKVKSWWRFDNRSIRI